MTGGYGTSRVAIEQHTVGQVAVTRVSAVPALSPRLRFDLAWTLGPLVHSGESDIGESYRLIDFAGELLVGPDDLFVGQLVRDESRHVLRSLNYVGAQQGSVALDLTGHQVEQLEECRAGGVLTMKMRLWPRIERGGVTADAPVSVIDLAIPRDDWVVALRVLTGEQIDLLEIRYDLVYADRFRPSLKELRRARDAVDRGDFNSAVVQARKAVTLMEESIKGATRASLKAALAATLDDSHAELYASIVSRAKGPGNITAHRADAREYTRVEALFAIRLATISIEVVAGLLAE